MRAGCAFSTRAVDRNEPPPAQVGRQSSPSAAGELVGEYDQLVSSGTLCDDPHQRRVVWSLQKLLQTLKGYEPSRPSWMSRVSAHGEGWGISLAAQHFSAMCVWDHGVYPTPCPAQLCLPCRCLEVAQLCSERSRASTCGAL